MKKKSILFLGIISLLSLPKLNFAQVAPSLGTASKFVMFTTSGAIGTTGRSYLTGDVGTGGGAITGFMNVTGVMHRNNSVTTQAAANLLTACNNLNAATANFFPAPVLGNGAILRAGVYKIASAASLNQTITLDAEGNINAVFIFQISGAFSISASSKIILINGASACNVFWVAGGAITIGEGATIRGNVISNPGTISMGAGLLIEGRLLSTTGAISMITSVAAIPGGCANPPVYIQMPAPNLGAVAAFEVFSSTGAVGATGTCYVSGNIGTSTGAITGFSNVSGSMHNNDSITTVAASDLETVDHQINALTPTFYPANIMGTGDTLNPGVMYSPATVSIDGIFTLNAQGNPDAVFVFIIGGALTTSAYSEIRLINGAKGCNVFWNVHGAITIASHNIFRGNIIAHVGAVNVGTNGLIQGRLMSTTGAINIYNTSAYFPLGCGNMVILPVSITSLTAICQQKDILVSWKTANEENIKEYTLETSVDGNNFYPLATFATKLNSGNASAYTWLDANPIQGLHFYRIKSTDKSGKESYSFIFKVNKFTPGNLSNIAVWPNYITGNRVLLKLNNVAKDIYSIRVYNMSGALVKQLSIKNMDINSSYSFLIDNFLPSGIYRVQLLSSLLNLTTSMIKHL